MTVAQVLVIAAALEVPPLLLVIPVGHVERTEILPNMNAPAFEAARWWRGEGHALKDIGEGPVLTTDPMQKNAADLVFQHQDLVVRWIVASRSAADAALAQSRTAPGQARDQWGEVSGSATRSAMQIERDLAELRKTMRAAGLVPPMLPSALDHLDARHLLD